ncbi:MAG: PEP-CTERM sorting domain-containing protein [Armatimonadetes bacterium]|nr:PEP-CTERM sorting domain-containing protein [Armatimonadota bacterium]
MMYNSILFRLLKGSANGGNHRTRKLAGIVVVLAFASLVITPGAYAARADSWVLLSSWRADVPANVGVTDGGSPEGFWLIGDGGYRPTNWTTINFSVHEPAGPLEPFEAKWSLADAFVWAEAPPPEFSWAILDFAGFVQFKNYTTQAQSIPIRWNFSYLLNAYGNFSRAGVEMGIRHLEEGAAEPLLRMPLVKDAINNDNTKAGTPEGAFTITLNPATVAQDGTLIPNVSALATDMIIHASASWSPDLLIPEPSSMLALASGILGAIGLAARRRRG